jgi:hypothetical protein
MFGGCWGSKKLKGRGPVILGPTMKFPITRESLQAFGYKKDQEEACAHFREFLQRV